MDGNSQAVRHLEGELHARGGAGTVGGEEAGRGALREEEREDDRSLPSGGRARGRSEGGGKEEAGLLYARRRSVPQTLSSWKGGQKLFLAALAGLRAELRCVNTQVRKSPRMVSYSHKRRWVAHLTWLIGALALRSIDCCRVGAASAVAESLRFEDVAAMFVWVPAVEERREGHLVPTGDPALSLSHFESVSLSRRRSTPASHVFAYMVQGPP